MDGAGAPGFVAVLAAAGALGLAPAPAGGVAAGGGATGATGATAPVLAAGAAAAGGVCVAAAFGSGLGLSDRVLRYAITSARWFVREYPGKAMAVPGA